MASEHEPTTRRQSHRQRRQVVIPRRVRVDYLNIVCTNETGEPREILDVVAPAQLEVCASFRNDNSSHSGEPGTDAA